MILTQILYKKQNETKSTIVLILGKKGNKTCCILDDKIDRDEAIIIRKNIKNLDKYNLQNKILWFKSKAPKAYKEGYRELISNNIKVQKAFSLNEDKYTHLNL